MSLKRSFFGAMLAACVLVFSATSQESPQDQYLKIYLLIQEADKLETAGQKASARERYQVSFTKLQELQTSYPQWEPTIVKFRIKYTQDKVKKLDGATDANPGQVIPPIPDDLLITPGGSTTTAPAQPSQPFQPTPAAPPILNPTPTQQMDSLAPSPIAQTGVSGASSLENLDINSLKARVRSLEAQLSDTKEKLTSAKTEAAQLRTRVQDLEGKIKVAMEGSTDDKIQLLMTENTRLKEKLASTETFITNMTGTSSSDSILTLKEQLDKIQDQLELARQENTALRQTNEEYKNKLEDLQFELAEAKNSGESQENVILRNIINRQLKEQARREIAKRIAMEELKNLSVESAKLKTQLDILGSPLVELTDDEKAMLRRPDAGLVVDASGEISATLSDGTFVEDYSSSPRVPTEFQESAGQANSLFQKGKFDEAAAIYQNILNSYPESLYGVSNLAVVRFQQGQYPEAETLLRQATKLSPQDAFSHSILGIVLYQQGKYDEAVQVLSRASALDPNDPKTRNYLGIAASQKGWQEAAEQECRKAIELDPQYGDAHFNLAVIYATQKPPAKELSRRHYNRALELGVPRDTQLESLIE
ncbi:MAG: tetratricopeptide repeat protein [Verrucomicrobiota bacterium]